MIVVTERCLYCSRCSTALEQI